MFMSSLLLRRVPLCLGRDEERIGKEKELREASVVRTRALML
jgi:hypothetical protein